MPACVPIRDLKDTAKFSALVESTAGPVTVTRNGRDAFVVLSTDEFQAMSEEVARAKLLGRMLQAEDELAAGDFADAAAFTSAVRLRHGL